MADSRPPEPSIVLKVWYRDWECGWDDDASRYGLEPWSAYKGGADLDAPHITGPTWNALLEEIDAQEE
jgi:hypothetical protein